MILALALAAAPLPGAIRFAPPPTPLVVTTQETHRHGARVLHFSMRHDIRFTRLGQGWRLDATLRGYATDADGSAKAAYEAAMRPLLDITVAVAVSAQGAPVGALDAETIWPKIAAAQAAAVDAIARTGAPPALVAALRAHFDQIATLPRPEREAMLTDFAWTLLALSAPDLRLGEAQPFADTIPVPGAGAVAERGQTRFESVTGDRAVFTLDAEVDPAALAVVADRLDATLGAHGAGRIGAGAQLRGTRVTRHDRSVVDRTTGLLIETVSARATRVPGEPDAVVARTTRVTPR